MIRNLDLQNFKSWRNVGLRLNKLTGLFGTNSSGKSSLIHFLLMLKQTAESADRAQVLDFGDDKSFVELGTYRDVMFNHDTNKSLKFQVDWGLENALTILNPSRKRSVLFEDDSLKFGCEIKQTEKGRLYVQEFHYVFSDYEFSMDKFKKDSYKYRLSARRLSDGDDKFKFLRTRGRSWELPHPIKFYGFPDQVNAYFQNTLFLSDLQLQFENLMNKIYYLGPLREFPKRQYIWAGANPSDMGRRGEQVVDAMLASKNNDEKISRGIGRPRFSVEEYVAYWLQQLNLIQSFRVVRLVKGGNIYRVLVKKNQASSEVLITDVGFGVSQILPVITLCYYAPPGATLIIEQPEIHLHPKVQAGLADIFIDAIKVRGVQIILESHSEHLLKRLQRRIAEEKFDADEASLYFCSNKNGESVIDQLELDDFGNILNWPEHFFGDDIGELSATAKAILKRKKG